MAAGVVNDRFSSLLVFALLFRLVQAMILLPLLAMAGRTLTGRPVVDSTEIVRFALSLRGLVTLLFVAAALFTLYLMEQAGLMAIVVGQLHGIEVSASDALKFVGGNVPHLLQLALSAIGRILLIILPGLLLAGVIAWRLLRHRDINYYLDLRPPRAIVAAAIVGAVLAITAAVLAYALLHWRMAVPATLGGMPASRALSSSAALSHPVWPRLALYMAVILGGGALLTSAVAWIVHQLGLVALGSRAGILGLLIVGVMGTITVVLHSLAGAAVAITDAALFATAWNALRQVPDEVLVPILERVAALPAAFTYDKSTRLVAWSGLGLLAVGAFNAWRMSDVLGGRRPTTVTAHRGSARQAPENSLSAIRQAITEGADYVEIDVQETKDGALVLVHDADLARLAGVTGRISEMTLAEVKSADIGARSDPAFAGERVPTLDEALEAVEGKARLMIELKYYPGDQRLAERVVETVRARGMSDQVVIKSLTYRGLEAVRRLAPRIWVGYLIATPVRDPHRLDVDFYSVLQRLIDPDFVLQAHRRGRKVLAWTVNDASDMARLSGMGVDNLITDVPAEARRVLHEQWDKDPVQLRLQRLRAWLGG
jgi:glycerophosphoryl diester phosphodiesterase